MLATLNDVLKPAQAGRYAVGLFNTTDTDMLQAAIEAAEEARSPIIIGTAEVLLPYGELPLIAPAGIAYVPVAGAPTVVMEGAGGAVCLGVAVTPQEELEPGELMLYSAGGASIVLKNSGKVLINGREVS